MDFEIRCFAPGDYDAVRALWKTIDGLGLSSADTREAITAFLRRNPELSLVAAADGAVIGALLVGHDGRRGYLHHLAVAPNARGRGVGQSLVDEGLRRLALAGIEKTHLFVFEDNAGGQQFWTAVGADERRELKLYSLPTARAVTPERL